MNIILTATDEPLLNAWERFCGDLPGVAIRYGSILEVACDAVVSPANSFGFMDGGIDRTYGRFFGWQIQERLQKFIVEQHAGELLVGTAEVVETDHDRIPYLIAAPTMRVPMVLRDSVNPYLAARAVFLLITRGVMGSGEKAGEPLKDLIRTVAFPGLGTGVGRVGPETCARQVRHAIKEVVLQQARFPATWVEAQSCHQQLYTDHLRDLQRD